jgi:hypothetical protein
MERIYTNNLSVAEIPHIRNLEVGGTSKKNCAKQAYINAYLTKKKNNNN